MQQNKRQWNNKQRNNFSFLTNPFHRSREWNKSWNHRPIDFTARDLTAIILNLYFVNFDLIKKTKA